MTEHDAARSPLSEADPRSLEALFSSRPPFDQQALRSLVTELRRMRTKWEQEEVEGKAKSATRKAKKPASRTVDDDIFGS